MNVKESPDDREGYKALEEAESIAEALWEIGEIYDVPLTNNYERWQNGIYLREVGFFIDDIVKAFEKHLAPEIERAAAEKAWNEGFDAAELDVFEHEKHNWDNDCIPNPYAKETQ